MFSGLWMFFHALIPPVNAMPVIVLVVALLYGALRQLRQTHWHVTQEIALLDICRAELRTIIDQRASLTGEHIRNWLRHAAYDSVTARGIRTVWASRYAANLDLEAIGSMLEQSESARLSYAHMAPNLLLLAGLLGTVLGLAGMVSTLGPQIQSTLNTADPLVLTRNLGETLRHMQNAFSCTMWGIIAAIWVSLAMRQVSALQGDLLAQVEEFCIRELGPFVFPRSQAAQLQDIQQMLQQSRTFLERVSEMMDKSAMHFEEVLTHAGQAMSDGIEHLHGVAGDMQSALTDVSSHVEMSAQALQQSTQEFIDSANSLRDYHQDLRNAYSELRGLFDESQARLASQVSAQLEQIDGMRKGFVASADRILEQLQRNSTELGEATSTFASAGTQFETAGLHTESRLENEFSHIRNSLEQLLADHQQQMGHVEVEVRHVANELHELSARLDPRMLPEGEWQAVREALTRCADVLSSGQEHALASSSIGQSLPTTSDMLTTYLAGIHETLRTNDLREEMQAMHSTMEAIRQAISPERRAFLGIPWPGWWKRRD